MVHFNTTEANGELIFNNSNRIPDFKFKRNIMKK
ncbi:hypothetical protein LEP1GSC116_0698, partial [Leptospira interrogans serovar Icterohaemorrhagiae str. Verdun HP]